jgi:signal transduction histidine kinase
MPPLSHTLREGLSLWSARSDDFEDTGLEEAFDQRRRRKLVDHGASVAAVTLAAALLFWPLDYVVLESAARGAFARWRLVAALASALVLVLTRFNVAPRALPALWVSLLLACTASVGDAMARAGDPASPYLHLLYLPLFATVTIPLRLTSRIALVVSVALSAALGYWGLHPAYRGHPAGALWWSVMLAVGALVVWLGHVLLLLARENFAHQRRLATWAGELEARVGERTAELRALLAHVEGVREDERTRIARELHDELGQELTGLAFVLRFTAERFERDPSAIRANLGELDAGLRRTSELVRELVSDLRPRLLDDLGLVPAVEWLARRTEERAGVRCKVIAGDLGEIPLSQRTVAFRVVQESLTNVLKHAKASVVEIEMVRRLSQLVVVVRDDGVGVAASRADATRSAGVGLVGMRERATALGGAFSVIARSPSGTEIRCSLPL